MPDTEHFKVQRGLTLPASTVWSCTAGVSNLWAADQYLLQISGSVRLEIKCTINVMHWNHPETFSPPSVHGNIAFHEICPWCRKAWGLLLYCPSPCSLCARPPSFFKILLFCTLLPCHRAFHLLSAPLRILVFTPTFLNPMTQWGGCLWPPQLVHMLSSLKEFQAAPS